MKKKIDWFEICFVTWGPYLLVVGGVLGWIAWSNWDRRMSLDEIPGLLLIFAVIMACCVLSYLIDRWRN